MRVTWTALFTLLFSAQLQAANWTVSPASDDNCQDNDCHLQSVLNIAASNFENDTISIAAGEYDASVAPFSYQPGDPENFSLSIQGAGIGQTIIDAKGAGQAFWAMPSIMPDDSAAHLDFSGITFRNGITDLPGGGLRIETFNANVEVEACAFESNHSSTIEGLGGGGLFINVSNQGSIKVSESVFDENSSSPSAGGGSVTLSSEGSVLLEGNSYLDNDAGGEQGTTGALGGGAVAFAVNGQLTIRENVFLRNFSEAGGGGLFAGAFNGSGTLVNNVVAHNSSLGVEDSQGFPGGGGGIRLFQPSGSLVLTNNTITENDSGGSGGGLMALLLLNQASVSVYNSVIWGNTATGQGLCSTSCNDIAVADHLDVDADQTGSVFNIANSDYSDIFLACQGPGCSSQATIGSGNLDVDPSFINATQNNFHLQAGSQVIDKGDSGATALPSTDFDGQPRISGAAPDMGAYEWSNAAPPAEDCDNGLDDDGDEQPDCEDSDCAAAPNCEEPPAEGEICDNGEDDDEDLLVDCFDFDCLQDDACFGDIDIPNPFELCSNGVDDDENGETDCEDFKCILNPTCIDLPGADCQSAVDCLHPDCLEAGICQDLIPDLPDIGLPSACTVVGGETSGPLSLIYLLVPIAWRTVSRRFSRKSGGRE